MLEKVQLSLFDELSRGVLASSMHHECYRNVACLLASNPAQHEIVCPVLYTCHKNRRTCKDNTCKVFRHQNSYVPDW